MENLQPSLVATASADGTHPSSGDTHETSAEAPENANEIDIVCDHCDDAGCSKCNDHREPSSSDSVSPGLSPADGSASPTASPGGTHEAKLVTSEPYYYVRWYIKGPGDTSSLGTLVQNR